MNLKNIIICLLTSLTLCVRSQTIIQFIQKNDLTFDYYRAFGISLSSSLILNKVTKKPILSGGIGWVTGVGQGLLLERGLDGKLVSFMGGSLGVMIYCVIGNEKNKKELFKLEHQNNVYSPRGTLQD